MFFYIFLLKIKKSYLIKMIKINKRIENDVTVYKTITINGINTFIKNKNDKNTVLNLCYNFYVESSKSNFHKLEKYLIKDWNIDIEDNIVDIMYSASYLHRNNHALMNDLNAVIDNILDNESKINFY